MKEPIDPLGEAVGDYIDVLEGKKPAGVAQIAGEAELTNEQRSRLPYVMAIWHDCFLCGAAPPPAGMYTWNMDGQTIITPICADCNGLDVKARIERALRERKQDGTTS